jgi:hypothetical protein
LAASLGELGITRRNLERCRAGDCSVVGLSLLAFLPGFGGLGSVDQRVSRMVALLWARRSGADRTSRVQAVDARYCLKKRTRQGELEWLQPELRRRFGSQYADYCERVPRWLPVATSRVIVDPPGDAADGESRRR